MFRDYRLTFPGEVATFVEEQYASADAIVEYGSGGSTFLGARLGKLVVSVESSAEWLASMSGALAERELPGKVIPVWADIGPTERWGRPVDGSHYAQWPDYARLPWQYCAEHDIAPDLVLIDGRFRLASFMATATSITRPTVVLFDDYVDRDYYHRAESLIVPRRTVGRMAVFDIEPGRVEAEQLLGMVECFVDPR